MSLVNGEDGGHSSTPTTKRGGTAGAQSVFTADNADDEDDNEEDEDITRQPLYEGAQIDHEMEHQQKSMFRSYLEHVDHTISLSDPQLHGKTVRDLGERYDVWNRAKLKTADVRKLVNQTLSQSVPGQVVTVVSAYTKMFAGLLIEGAREVQAEWLAVEARRADGEENAVFKRLKRFHGGDEEHETNGEVDPRPKSSQSGNGPNGIVKQEDNSSSSPTQPDTQTDAHLEHVNDELHPGGAGGLSTSLEECDRGPLLPDHLREALRRYKKGREGGTVGFTGLSLEGREVAASRMGGRRLFR